MLATDHGNGSEQVFDHLKNITQTDWFTRYLNYGLVSVWNNKYSVPFSLILTRWGLCYNFNLLGSSELLNMNDTSADFHYKADVINLAYIPNIDSNSINMNESAPWSALNNQRFLTINFNTLNYKLDNPFEEMQGFHMIFHSNFEFPFATKKNHFQMGFSQYLSVDIIPIVYEADDSLQELNPDQ